jgi:hypothetical protein
LAMVWRNPKWAIARLKPNILQCHLYFMMMMMMINE